MCKVFNKHFIFRIFLILYLSVGYWSIISIGCGSAQEFRVGVLLPLNGKLAIAGNTEKKAIELASEQINGPMVSDSNIVFKFADSLGEPEGAKQAMEELIANGISAVIGGCSSSATLAAAKVAEEHGIPFLITTASADKITEMGMKYIFRLCLPSSEYQKPIDALLNRKKRLWRAAILREKSRFGEYETRKIIRVCRKARVLITDVISYSVDAQTDEATYFPRLREVGPQILFVFCNGREAAKILTLCEAMERPPRLLIAKGEPFLNPETFLEAQVLTQNIYTISLWHPSVSYEGVREFTALFSEKYGIEPDFHAAQAYAAVQVIADAITKALSPEPADLREALEQTQMMTVFGPVAFLSYGDKDRQNRPPALLLRWQNGRLSPVKY